LSLPGLWSVFGVLHSATGTLPDRQNMDVPRQRFQLPDARAHPNWLHRSALTKPASGGGNIIAMHQHDSSKTISQVMELCRSLPGGTLTTTNVSPLHTGDVYQFGVARGRSLKKLVQIFNETTWGFDTFTGMPRELRGQPTISIWSQGHFSPGGPDANVSLARAIGGRLNWVIGDYDDTLTTTLANNRSMQKARYVDIDCDLYRSSHRALHWMFKTDLISIGTIIGYDDFWDLPCSMSSSQRDRHPFLSGEGRVHAEVASQYKVRFRCICGPCQSMPATVLASRNSWRTYFIVEGIQSESHSTGFTMSDDQMAYFLEHNSRCRESGSRWKTYIA
jgi:hypothetical protein